jgi:phosphoadenosine phosphosulfate reductase
MSARVKKNAETVEHQRRAMIENGAPSPTSRLTSARARVLADKWRALGNEALIAAVLGDAPAGGVAVVSSFGIESAVLLDMVARVDRTVPIVFVDTGRLFPETLAYRNQLVDRLGLTDVRSIAADAARVARVDPDAKLHRSDSEACCRVRKIEPYLGALTAFDVEITGRKRFQGGARADLRTVERLDGRLKVNPLAHWSEAAIDSAFDQRGLPRHPLYFDGYDSVGCTVCTRRRRTGEAARAGRWADSEKTECGIHIAYCGAAPSVVRGSREQGLIHVVENERGP